MINPYAISKIKLFIQTGPNLVIKKSNVGQNKPSLTVTGQKYQ